MSGSSFQDDSDGNDLASPLPEDPDAINLYLDDVVNEIVGVIAGLDEQKADAKEGDDVMLDSNVGQLSRTYLDYWVTRLMAETCMLEDKTTLGEVLLFIASAQAEMDLLAQGEHVQ